MAQQRVPTPPSYAYANYTDLRGIDLTEDVTQIPRNRAADILNMMPDLDTGNPRKRVGWRKLYSFGASEQFKGSRHIVEWGIDLIVTDKKICIHHSSDATWTASNVTVFEDLPEGVDDPAAFIGFDSDDVYLFNAHGHRRGLKRAQDGTITMVNAPESYVPMTVISRDPDGLNGYAYEAVNAFTPQRVISFHGDGTAKTFYFYPAADRASHCVVSVVKVEGLADTGLWEQIPFTVTTSGASFSAYTSEDKSTTGAFTKVESFTITNTYSTQVAGMDNIRATIVEFDNKTDENGINYGYWSPIVSGLLEHGVCARYGMTNMDREFFVTSHNRIYYTDPERYNYLPDNNYIQVAGDAPIVGFHRKNTFLVAITQDSSEFTIYMIAGATRSIVHNVVNESGITETTTEEMTYFTAKTALSGIGAIAKGALATLVDDTLFLSRRGIYGITSNTVTSETVVANSSELINPRLIEERHLENAVATIWHGMYVLSVNGHGYILDSRETHKNKGVSYGYECYYWTNFAASDMLSYEGSLFFGDYDGNWCRLNTDIENYTAYEDDGQLDEHGNVYGGDAIHAMYKFRLDADNYPQYLKTLNKRGTSIELMQLKNSGVKLSYSKNANEAIVVGDLRLADKFTWSLVDFENFSFDSSSSVRTFYPKKKVKKYKYLQFILESTEIDQDFGICGITKTYYLGNFAKR